MEEVRETLIGKVIDMSLEDFKKELKEQEVNVGIANNMIVLLVSTYNNLVEGKDDIIQSIKEGILERDDEQVTKALNGIYSEMLKIEAKVTYLKEWTNNLLEEVR